MSRYYARNSHDLKLDAEIRQMIVEHGDSIDKAFHTQNQEILNLMRTIYQMLKGYAVPEGYMGWIDSEKRYRLFATEEEYKEFVAEVE